MSADKDEEYFDRRTAAVFDRRTTARDDIARLIDQNQGVCNTIQSLVATVNNHETRIAVIEVRLSASASEVEEIKNNGQETLKVLAEHTKQEDKDRQKLLTGVIATLLSVLGAIVMMIANRIAV